MQNIIEYSKADYIKLIAYLKLNYAEGTLYSRSRPDDYEQLKEDVEKLFKIGSSLIQINKTTWIKRYAISGKTKKWNFVVGNASLLFAHNMQSYRNQLIEDEIITGVITLKKAFFEASAISIPIAIILFGAERPEKVWLTSAASSEDLINIFTDIHLYQRNVFFTDQLDTKNLMPENYNGEKEKIDEVLEKYETKSLQEIADIILGRAVRRWELGDAGIPYLRQRDIQQGSVVYPNVFVVESAVEKYAKQLLQEGDILLTKNFGQHKVAKVTADNLPALASNSLFIIRSFGVPDEYLYQYFTSNTGKTILEKQLSSIERGATVVTISMADLKELKVPIFDTETMLAFSQAEEMKAPELIPTISHMSRMQAYSGHLNSVQTGSLIEAKVYDEFIKTGWPQDELKMNERIYSIDLKAGKWIPDIALLDGDEWVGAVEIKTDFSRLPKEWISKIREVLEETKVPCLVLSTGFYYEVHFTHLPLVKKLTEAPSKEFLLSFLNGKVVTENG